MFYLMIAVALFNRVWWCWAAWDCFGECTERRILGVIVFFGRLGVYEEVLRDELDMLDDICFRRRGWWWVHRNKFKNGEWEEQEYKMSLYLQLIKWVTNSVLKKCNHWIGLKKLPSLPITTSLFTPISPKTTFLMTYYAPRIPIPPILQTLTFDNAIKSTPKIIVNAKKGNFKTFAVKLNNLERKTNLSGTKNIAVGAVSLTLTSFYAQHRQIFIPRIIRIIPSFLKNKVSKWKHNFKNPSW